MKLMDYCKVTRELLSAYKKETEDQIYALQRKVYELQSRVNQLEQEKYFETKMKNNDFSN